MLLSLSAVFPEDRPVGCRHRGSSPNRASHGKRTAAIVCSSATDMEQRSNERRTGMQSDVAGAAAVIAANRWPADWSRSHTIRRDSIFRVAGSRRTWMESELYPDPPATPAASRFWPAAPNHRRSCCLLFATIDEEMLSLICALAALSAGRSQLRHFVAQAVETEGRASQSGWLLLIFSWLRSSLGLCSFALCAPPARFICPCGWRDFDPTVGASDRIGG